MQTLRQYLTDNEMKQAAFARHVGMSRGFLGDLIAGRRTPGLALAKKISDATGGAVPMSSWLAGDHEHSLGREAAHVQGTDAA